MSRAVTRSSSRVRSLTPESAMVPPCDKANFQQRIKSAKNMEPKRSEEHTSELQSLTNLVCRLLLEKKKPRSHRAVTSGRGQLRTYTVLLGARTTRPEADDRRRPALPIPISRSLRAHFSTRTRCSRP